MLLEQFCAKICRTRIWFIVLFVFAAFELINSQGEIDYNDEFYTTYAKKTLHGAGVVCLRFQSHSLPILSDRRTILRFKKWFLRYEEFTEGCLLKFLRYCTVYSIMYKLQGVQKRYQPLKLQS